MPQLDGELPYEIGDTSHIELRRYSDGKGDNLDDWSLSMLGALTLPGTPYRMEMYDAGADTGHMETVDGKWVRSDSIEIFGPEEPHWLDLAGVKAPDFKSALDKLHQIEVFGIIFDQQD